MKNWLKENWFKLGILCVVALGVGIYSISLIQKSNREERAAATQALENQQMQLQTDSMQAQQAQALEDANNLKAAEIAQKNAMDQKRAACLSIESSFNDKKVENIDAYFQECMNIYSAASSDSFREQRQEECRVEHQNYLAQQAAEYQAGIAACAAKYSSN